MCGAVQAGEGPIGVYETDYEGYRAHVYVSVCAGLMADCVRNGLTDAIGAPSGIIYEVCKDKLSGLVRRSFGRDSDEDDDKGDQGGVEGDVGDCRERSGVAIKQKGHEIDKLVGNDDMPRLYHANREVSRSLVT